MERCLAAVLLAIAAPVLAGERAVAWRHISTAKGDLAVPNGGNQQTSSIVADIDGDRVNDFVITERTKAPSVVWYRRGPSGWTRYVVDDVALHIEAGSDACDIDGDGDLDIAAGGDFASNEVWWWENPCPEFDPKVPWKRRAIKASGATKHHDQLFGDFDGDGRPEFVFWNQGARKLFIAEIPADPRKTQPWECAEIYSWRGDREPPQRGKYPGFKAVNEHEGLAKADIDGDGKLDIVGGGRWFKHEGGTRYTPNVIDEGYAFSRAAVGQIIPGGRPEVVLVVGDGWAPLVLYEWREGVWKDKVLVPDIDCGHSLGLVDFDRDGNLDIWVAEMRLNGGNPGARNMLLLGDGKGGFETLSISNGIENHESKIADLDGDGDLDVLGKPYNFEAPRLDIWINEGTRRPPNVVLILVDDLGWADLTCCGSRYYETPNLDRLASQGMRFTDAYAACAVCSPTRAAVMTGRYPARVGITDWIRAQFQGGKRPAPDAELPAYVEEKGRALRCPRNPLWMELSEMTIAEALKPAGYVSCHIGKWHLGMDDWYPEKQGFDINIGGCDFGQPPSYFDPYERKGQGGIPTLAPRKKGEYLTDREADEAVRFIREHKDRPFFLYMAHYAVHTPLEGKPDVVARYKAKPATNQKNPVYAAMVESVDDAAGRILGAIDELDLAERTIVIFTSDNGGLMGPTHNAPLRDGKGTPYEGGIRVPLIVRWPGVVRPGSICRTPVTSVDYFPTILAAAGVPLPADRAIDGVNLLPILSEKGSLPRDSVYWHFPHYRGDVMPYSIIRAGDWKLIKRHEGTPFELFDLSKDLGETRDLTAEMPAKVKELDASLSAWLASTGARLPRPLEEDDPVAR